MAKNDEYELKDNDDYEVVPLTPIRRLEKRMTQLEGSKSLSNMERMMDKILDMVELNQRVVDEMVKANTSLRKDLSTLMGKIDTLQDKVTKFVDVVVEAGQDDVNESEAVVAVKGIVTPLVKSITDANEKLLKSNEAIAENISTMEKRLKRTSSPPIGPANPNPSMAQFRPQGQPQQGQNNRNTNYGGI